MTGSDEERSKRCPDCAEVKPATAFSKNPARSDGLQFYCKSCYSKRAARYYRARQAKLGRTVREHVAVPDGMKYCPRCGVVNPHEQFHRSRTQYDGLFAHCKSCRAEDGRRRYFRKTHGLEPEEVEVMLEQQGGHCPICLRTITIESAHLDHDHATDEVRGLLCFNCNSSLGKLGDDPATIRRAADYIEGDLSTAVAVDRERLLRRLAKVTQSIPARPTWQPDHDRVSAAH